MHVYHFKVLFIIIQIVNNTNFMKNRSMNFDQISNLHDKNISANVRVLWK